MPDLDMNERPRPLKHLEGPFLTHLRDEIATLAGKEELTIEETVAQRDLEFKLSLMEDWNSLRGTFRRGKKEVVNVASAGREKVGEVMTNINEEMKSFWGGLAANRETARAEQEEIWKMRMADYEYLVLKQAAGEELSGGEVVLMERLEAAFFAKEAQEYLLSALAKAQAQLDDLTESVVSTVERNSKTLYKLLAAQVLVASLAAACAPSRTTVPATPTVDNRPSATAPVPTEVATQVATRTVTSPTATSVATGVPPTQTPDVSPTPAASATPEAKPTEQTVEQWMTKEDIQANIDKFKNMTPEEYKHQVERLFWANDGPSRDSLKDVSFLTQDGQRLGLAHQHRLGIIGDFTGSTGIRNYPVEGVLLGVQSIKDTTADVDVTILYIGTDDGLGDRIVLPVYYGDNNVSTTKNANRIGYLPENTANYDTKNVDGEVIEQRTVPMGGTTDLTMQKNDFVRTQLLPRVGDVLVWKLSEPAPNYDPNVLPPDRRHYGVIAKGEVAATSAFAEALIARTTGKSADRSVIDSLPKSVLGDTVDDQFLFSLPCGSGTVTIATPIHSFLSGK